MMVQCGAGSASLMIDNDCGCHLLVEDVEVHTDHGVSVKCKFTVLASTDPGQAGKEQSEFFSCEGKAVDKFYNLAEACGVITAQQRKAAADQGAGLEVDEKLLKGRQLCASIKMEDNMRKNPSTGQYEVDPEKPGPFPRIGFRSFAVTDKKAEGIPKDQQFLGMISQQAGQQAQASQSQEPTTPPATTGGGMNW